jgi:hypothetical protein
MLTEVAPLAQVEGVPSAAHRRRLDFRTSDGSGTIYFDQGVGSWRVSNISFDHSAPMPDQVRALKQSFSIANISDGTFIAVRMN